MSTPKRIPAFFVAPLVFEGEAFKLLEFPTFASCQMSLAVAFAMAVSYTLLASSLKVLVS